MGGVERPVDIPPEPGRPIDSEAVTELAEHRPQLLRRVGGALDGGSKPAELVGGQWFVVAVRQTSIASGVGNAGHLPVRAPISDPVTLASVEPAALGVR